MPRLSPGCMLVVVTVGLTTAGSSLLAAAILTDYWEHVTFDPEQVAAIAARTNVTEVDRIVDGLVARLLIRREPRWRGHARVARSSRVVFLVPLYGGIWRLCTDLKDNATMMTTRLRFRVKVKTDMIVEQLVPMKCTDESYKCNRCSKTFSYRKIYQNHVCVAQVNAFLCPHCPKKYLSIRSLRYHQKIHHALPALELNGGGERSSAKKRKGVAASGGKNRYQSCPRCSKSMRPNTLKNHTCTGDPKKPHRCPECPKMYRSMYDVKVHLSSRHKITLAHQSDRPFECVFCSRSFSRQSNLNAHKRSHEMEIAHHCEDSLDNFDREQRREDGSASQDDEISFDEVDDASESEENSDDVFQEVERRQVPKQNEVILRMRRNSQHQQPPPSANENYPCRICGKEFAKMNSLQGHMATHSSILLKCSHCQKKFIAMDEKLEHEAGHQKIAELNHHKCDKCGIVYDKKSDLFSHQRVHLKVDAVELVAAADLNVNSAATPTRKRRHSERAWACAKCDKHFSYKTSYEKHVQNCNAKSKYSPW